MVTLPRASPGPMGRTRNAVLPDAGDVQQVPLRSGGVPQVPNVAAQGGEDVGASLFQVGAMLQKAAENETKRMEGLDRLRIMRQYREKASELSRQTMAEGDPLDPRTTKDFGDTLNELDSELLKSHAGRPDSQARLLDEMQTYRLGIADRVSNHMVEKQKKVIDGEIKNELNDAVAQLQSNPESFDSIYRQKVAAIDNLNISESDKAAHKDVILGTMGEFSARTMIKNLKSIPQGSQEYRQAVEETKDILESPDFKRAWTPKTRLALQTELDAAVKSTTFKTLSPQELKSQFGLDAAPNTAYQVGPNGQLHVTAGGRKESFTASVAASDIQLPSGTTIKKGQEFFATEDQLAKGLATPRPQAALVNIGLQPPPTEMTPSGGLKPGARPAGGQPVEVPGVGTVTTMPRVGQAQLDQPEQPKGDVGLFRFLTPKDQLNKKSQVDALRSNIELIDKISADIKKNPTNYGAIGTLKKAGQSALGVASDVGDAIDIATGIKIKEQAGAIFKRLTAEGLEREIGIDFNPNLPKIELWENTLALQLAKLRIGQGDTEVRAITKAYNDAKADTKLTGFTFKGDVEKRLEEVKDFFKKELDSTTKALSGQGATDNKDDLKRRVEEILKPR